MFSVARFPEGVRGCGPVKAQAGNTSLRGGSVPLPGDRGVILSLSHMRRIREIDTANNSITVEAGCVLAGAQRAAVEAGRFYAVSLLAEMRQYKSETELALMRSIKHALDPRGLFNPAKVIPQQAPGS
jgi:FAD/FMN-containing dehydrogenase